MRKLMLVLFVSVMLLAGTANANLLNDGGLETATNGQLSGTGALPSVWWYYGNGDNAWVHSDAGYKNGNKGVVLTWDAVGIVADSEQAFQAGSDYEISVEAITPDTEALKGMDLVLRIEFINDSWATIGGMEVDRFYGMHQLADNTVIDAGDGTETWTTLSGTVTAIAGTAHIRTVVELAHHAWDGRQHSGKVYFDDASVTLVPEPATLFILGLGGMLLRRKK